MPNEVAMQCRLNVSTVPADSKPRLVYLMVDIRPTENLGLRRSAVNLGVVLDVSDSMRALWFSPEHYEELGKLQGYRTIQDGIPLTIHPYLPDHIRRAASVNLETAKQALLKVVDYMRSHDRFSLVVFAERSTVLLHSRAGTARARISDAVSLIDNTRLGDETYMAPAIESSLDELQAGRVGDMVNRMFVLTDGVARDAEPIMKLVAQARRSSVAVSTVGVGNGFNEKLLIDMADKGGGNAYFAPNPEDILRVFKTELDVVQSIKLRRLVARIRFSTGVSLHRAYRIHPAIGPLPDVPLQDRAVALDLGDLEPNDPPTLLLELIVPPHPIGMFRIADVMLAYEMPDALTGQVSCDATLNYVAAAVGSDDPQVMKVVRAVNAFRLQSRALDDAASGNVGNATAKLHSAARILRDAGETAAATEVSAQAQKLDQTRQISNEDRMSLRFKARVLPKQLDEVEEVY